LWRLHGKLSCSGENVIACRTAARSATNDNAERNERQRGAQRTTTRSATNARRGRTDASASARVPSKKVLAIDPGGPVAATDRLCGLLRIVARREHRAARLRKLRRVIAKTGNDAIDIGNLRATEPHDIRRAGHLLLHGAAVVLRERRASA